MRIFGLLVVFIGVLLAPFLMTRERRTVRFS